MPSSGPKRTEQQRRRVKANRLFVAEETMRRGCLVCGFDASHVALDLHHVGDDKFKGVARMMSYPRKTIVEEMAKCIVLCANCHRMVTHGVITLEDVCR
jgi:hypothetical protein